MTGSIGPTPPPSDRNSLIGLASAFQQVVRQRLVAQIRPWRLPAWVDDAADCIPVLDAIGFALWVVSLTLSAELGHQPWLRPVVIYTLLLGCVVMVLHWRAAYLRRKGNARHATILIAWIIAGFFIYGGLIAVPLLSHWQDTMRLHRQRQRMRILSRSQCLRKHQSS